MLPLGRASTKIFISYRRDDSAADSGRIYDRLEPKYRRDNVFKDVDAIPLGVDFRRVLTEEVAKCDVMLVVMGRQWVNIADESDERRLDNPNDFVRIEVEAALARDIPVIPVLVQNTSMPRERDLPASLAPLAYRNGIVIRGDPSFHRDMDLLIGRLDTLFSTPDAIGLPGAATAPTFAEPPALRKVPAETAKAAVTKRKLRYVSPGNDFVRGLRRFILAEVAVLVLIIGWIAFHILIK